MGLSEEITEPVQGDIFVLFANGGWLQYDPVTDCLMDSGEDWETLLKEKQPAPEQIFRAVPLNGETL